MGQYNFEILRDSMEDQNKRDNKVLIEYKNEILATIEKIFLHQNPVILIQENGDDLIERWALIKHLNAVSNEITLRPVNDDEIFEFTQKDKITVKNASESIVFETKVASICKDKILSINIPEAIYLENTRNNTRYHFGHKSHPVFLYNLNADPENELRATLLDVSVSGIALRVECSELEAFKESDKLSFLKIHNYSFSEDTFGTIVYVRKVQEYGTTQYYKLGIHFDSPIPLSPILERLRET